MDFPWKSVSLPSTDRMDMNTKSEKELLKLLSSTGEGQEAFSEIYVRYSGKCFGFINAMIKDEDAAKDMTHDIFVKVWLKRMTISKVDSFSSYLFRMTRNAVFDYFESNAINRKYIARQALCQEEFRSYVEEKVNLHDIQLMVFEAVSRMPEQRRRIFTLSRYNGIPNKEIAMLLGLNIRTVENHLTNALADIRAALAKN